MKQIFVGSQNRVFKVDADEASLAALPAYGCVFCHLDKSLITRIHKVVRWKETRQFRKFRCEKHGYSVLFSTMYELDILSAHTQGVTETAGSVNVTS